MRVQSEEWGTSADEDSVTYLSRYLNRGLGEVNEGNEAIGVEKI